MARVDEQLRLLPAVLKLAEAECGPDPSHRRAVAVRAAEIRDAYVAKLKSANRRLVLLGAEPVDLQLPGPSLTMRVR